MAIELKLPAVSADMEYGTITRWLKSEGDRVAGDEPVVEVEARIVAAEGDEIKGGATMAIIDEDA